ncbi:4-aminobutyrate--2-oxoglutarate transaminase [Aeromonas caviae]|jgi:4-aminobutyrate aminotransferase/(S)-3-amino-2-methylpropionate transaminase|uniref:4-aminobutyrate transaminase n=1 Tax=Aeromonas caviae TaxID=648 RepID=A0A6I4WJE8_AERCA|nr:MULTISPECIES: 4-aminobutyrate--2-oxoglutarate transaminase [Aeromonas]MBP8079836.1 4-aminobutyrate--2-oxoglutarate transaminase [Aeromonas sp.]AUU21769.1 4-aminobutyrate--2-oxoglutarate transaminase [Aeromonas caviae]MBL0484630.1 4-aminobutyrate--2-oxoglutarate transaminase [Aeromonas caviae]MBP4067899.1 4-aminobutyrate--2-oxoglutarate transaminase [Aeromonas sp. MaB10011B]MBP4080144.1 4-aminobutyrate--2-oxoglutarate transaminase [Aeromonas sp. MrichA-1]
MSHSSNNQQWQARREAAVVQGVGTLLPVFIDRAHNAELWDVEGNRYIDFASGIAVLNTGHNHPKVVAAVREQLEKFSHTCFQVTPYSGYIELAEKLNALVPGPTPKRTLFLSTGAEAVENAIKIARAHTGRSGTIAFKGGFHGRTMMGMALTGKVVPYKTGFGPFPGEVYHLPFPADYLGVSEDDALAALDLCFSADIEPTRVAAIIIEPVQGEGGFYPASASFMQRLRQVCDQHGILLICDEIQTGFCRTGKTFATEYSGVEPDIMTLAKSLAGGFPLSAVVGKSEVMNAAKPGGLGGTYAGSPIACAAALAVLEVIEEERLNQKALAQGEQIKARLHQLATRFDCIGNIRGPGAMVAMELVKEGDAERPDPDLTKRLVAEAGKRGLVLLACGVRGNVIRFLAPLTAPAAIVDEGLDLLEQALSASLA